MGIEQALLKMAKGLLYKHFCLPGHSVAHMKIQILEKIYHSSQNPVNFQLHQRIRELHWIKELGTAAPYGCNHQIKGLGTLSCPSCKHTNVLGIFNKQQRRKRSHGHRHHNRKAPQLDSSIDTFVNLVDSIDQPQGVHKIKTAPLPISLPKLRELQSLAQESTNYDYESVEYRVTATILDTAQYGLFRSVYIIPNSTLRDLIAKGPKYREPCKVDWDKNLSLLCEAVDQYALHLPKELTISETTESTSVAYYLDLLFT